MHAHTVLGPQVCNHQFHGECLKKWGDTSCPVCRFCMFSSAATTSRCSTCGSGSNLWICLICGHVGCGRYKSGHAHNHWQASQHCYALELETQRVGAAVVRLQQRVLVCGVTYTSVVAT